MHKKLDYFIKILVGLSFFVPLILVSNSFIFPFIVPKILVFRTISLLMLGAYLLLLFANSKKYKLQLTPINIVVGLFFTSFLISTFVGVDWYRSLWDNHERMLGLFTVFHYIIYYFVVTSVIREWRDWKYLLRIFLFAGSIVMFIGLLQKADPEFLLNRGSDRVSATLGNSIYFSGYGLFLVFIGFLLAIKESVKKENFWFWYAVVGSILGFWGIFGGGTRGALLGLVAGLGVLLISYLFALKNHKRIKQTLGGLILLGVVIVSLLFGFRQTNFVKNIPTVGRLASTEISSTNTRVMAWGIAIEAWQEKPVFGWGPNNYYYAFNKHYRAEFLRYGYNETWFDNAHSVIMNTLAVQGGFGILVYLSIYIVAILYLWKAYKKDTIDVHVASVGSAFLVAHLVSLITVFENPTSYLYFFFFLAFVNSNITKNTIKNTRNRRIPTTLGVLTGFVILLFIFSTNINPAKANMSTLNTLRAVQNGGDVPALYKKAVSVPSPHVDDIRNDFTRFVNQLTAQYIKNKDTKKGDEIRELFDLAYDGQKQNLVLHPMDIRLNIQLSQLAANGVMAWGEQEFLFEAEKYLDDALTKSPERQQIIYVLSGLKFQLNKGDEAVKLLQDSISYDETIAEGWWRLALTHKQLGDYDKAVSVIEEAFEKEVVFKDSEQRIIGEILK